MTLPDGWTRVDLSAGDLEAIMAAAGELDPALAQAYTDQIATLVGAGLVIFAFGPDATTGTNVNVLALPAMGVSLDLIEQLNTSQIEQLADGDVEVERVQLPAGESVHFSYTVAAGRRGLGRARPVPRARRRQPGLPDRHQRRARRGPGDGRVDRTPRLTTSSRGWAVWLSRG